MPTRDRVQAFIALVEGAHYVEALQQFYHPDATMQDNQQPPRLGLERLIADECATMARFRTMRTDKVTDLLIDGDKVMIRWRFTFTPAEGPPMAMEEITLRRWAATASPRSDSSTIRARPDRRPQADGS